VRVERITAGARAAIEKAGGKVEPLPRRQTMGEKQKAEKTEKKAKAKAKA
jgi:large subunit ribosomal protein L15